MTAVAWQRVEGALVLAAAAGLFAALGPGWPGWPVWLTILVFFAPDLTFAAYAAGPRAGAAVYNAAHLYGPGALLLAAGALWAMPLAAGIGALWLGHAGFDRMLGYGLKLPQGFGQTHLGPIGPARRGEGQGGRAAPRGTGGPPGT